MCAVLRSTPAFSQSVPDARQNSSTRASTERSAAMLSGLGPCGALIDLVALGRGRGSVRRNRGCLAWALIAYFDTLVNTKRKRIHIVALDIAAIQLLCSGHK